MKKKRARLLHLSVDSETVPIIYGAFENPPKVGEGFTFYIKSEDNDYSLFMTTTVIRNLEAKERLFVFWTERNKYLVEDLSDVTLETI